MSLRSVMEDAKRHLADEFPDAEVITGHDGDSYLLIPTGHAEAVELELIDGKYYVTALAWDRTGGVSSEAELANEDYWLPAVSATRLKTREILAEYARQAAIEDAHFAELDGDR